MASNNDKEKQLLEIIHNSLPETIRFRYHFLRKKQQKNTLSFNERIELLELVEIIENADVKRLKALVELAEIRKTSLDGLILQLELTQF